MLLPLRQEPALGEQSAVLRGGSKLYGLPRQALRQPSHGLWRQRTEARVATDGLAVVEQDDRLAIRRYLHGAQRDAFGDHRTALALQLRAVETNAHAVGALIDQPLAVEGVEQALAAEVTDLRTQHQLQARCILVLGNELGGHLPRFIGVAAPAQSIADSDGAAMPSAELPLLESTGASTRYGRLFLENTYGPETMDLKVPFEAQIWNGSRFERHTDENCWTYNTADAVITDTPPATSVDAETGTLTGGAPVSGAELLLEAPGEGNTGSVLVRYPVPSYWQDDFDGNGSVEDSTATATFGVYRGHDRVIYWQEVLD